MVPADHRQTPATASNEPPCQKGSPTPKKNLTKNISRICLIFFVKFFVPLACEWGKHVFRRRLPDRANPPRRDQNNGRKKVRTKIRRGVRIFSHLDGGGLGPGPWAPCLGPRQWESASWAWGPRLWARAPCPCPGPPVWTERHSKKTNIKSPTQDDSPNSKIRPKV